MAKWIEQSEIRKVKIIKSSAKGKHLKWDDAKSRKMKFVAIYHQIIGEMHPGLASIYFTSLTLLNGKGSFGSDANFIFSFCFNFSVSLQSENSTQLFFVNCLIIFSLMIFIFLHVVLSKPDSFKCCSFLNWPRNMNLEMLNFKF